MMYYDGNAGHGSWMLFSMGITVVFLAGLVWIIARLIIDGSKRDDRPTAPRGPDALIILQQRYASGELDDAEYDHRRQVLLGKP
jgi:putative membrane protein